MRRRQRRSRGPFVHLYLCLSPSSPCSSASGQLDSVGVLFIAVMFFGKDLFEPVCLFFSDPFVHELGLMTDDELLAASLTPDGTHLLEASRFLLLLALLDRYCL